MCANRTPSKRLLFLHFGFGWSLWSLTNNTKPLTKGSLYFYDALNHSRLENQGHRYRFKSFKHLWVVYRYKSILGVSRKFYSIGIPVYFTQWRLEFFLIMHKVCGSNPKHDPLSDFFNFFFESHNLVDVEPIKLVPT